MNRVLGSVQRLRPGLHTSPATHLYPEPPGLSLGEERNPCGRSRRVRYGIGTLPIWGIALLMAALFSTPASAADITGRVTNATTGRPADDISVGLLALQRGMQTVAVTVTDSHGRYKLTVEANPGERFLVQATYGGVNYNQPVEFTGANQTVDITVYESGAAKTDVAFTEHVIFVLPGSDTVRFTELYSLNNGSNPPKSYTPEETFLFAIPRGAQQLEVSVSTQSGLPLKQQSQESLKDPNLLALSYAFRPGDSQVQVSYAVPFSGDALDLMLPLAEPARSLFVVIPSLGAEITNSGFEEQPQTISPNRRIFVVRNAPPKELPLRMTFNQEELARLANRTAASQTPAPQNSNPITLVPHALNQNPRQFFIVGLILFVLFLGLYYLNSLEPRPSATHDATLQSNQTGQSSGANSD